MMGTNNRTRNSGTLYQASVQLIQMYPNEVTDGPKPSMHSLQTIPFLFIGPHIESLSSASVFGSCMACPSVDTLWPSTRKYRGHLVTVTSPVSSLQVAQQPSSSKGPLPEHEMWLWSPLTQL